MLFALTHGVYSRIDDDDFVFKNDRHRIHKCDTGTRDISDHSTLHLDNRPKKTVWRLSMSLLNNKAVIQQIKDEIKAFLELNYNGDVNPSVL